MDSIPNGISLREALRTAQILGFDVRYVSGTGEWLVRGPHRCVSHNARRKVASRALVVLLRRGAERSATQAAA